MKTLQHIIYMVTAAVMMTTAACSRHDRGGDEPAGDARKVYLSIYVNLNSSINGIGGRSRAVGDEYEPDKWAADDGERMHKVRVIVLDAANYVEHNELWDLSAAPDTYASGHDMLVKAGELKTILLVANEDYATLTTTDGTTMSAADYFRTLTSSVGSRVDPATLRALTMTIDNNSDNGGSTLRSPLAMSAIHNFYIGSEPHYSKTFTIHRAAVKYTYRITNNSADRTCTVNSVAISNVASRQYFFPDADFTDDTQYFWTAYRTPDAAGVERQFTVERTLAPGESCDVPAIYLPEGHNVPDGQAAYRTGLYIDGMFTGWRDIEWSMPQTPDDLRVMTDLPRNTHVIINVSYNFIDWTMNYTVCPWDTGSAVIPPFN